MASMFARQWFQPGDGISREVITADIQRYLGPDALVRPGTGIGEFEGVDGYWITAYRTFTTQMITDLRMDSQRWRAEGLQGRVAYRDSRTHQSRQYYGPSPPQPAIEPQRMYTQTQSDTPGYADPSYRDLSSNHGRTQPSQVQDRETAYASYRQPPAGYIVQGDHYVLGPRGYPSQGLPQGVPQQRPMDPVYADPRFPQPARGEDPRNQRDPRDTRDTMDPRDLRDPRDTRDPRSIRDPRDARDPPDPRYQREQDMRGGYQYSPQPSTAQASRNGDHRYMPGSQPSAPTPQYDQYGQPHTQIPPGGTEYPPQPRDPNFRDLQPRDGGIECPPQPRDPKLRDLQPRDGGTECPPQPRDPKLRALQPRDGGTECPPQPRDPKSKQPRDPQFRVPRGQAPPKGQRRRRGDGGGDRRERDER